MSIPDHDRELYAFHHADSLGDLTEKLNHNITVLGAASGMPVTYETIAERHKRIAAKLALIPKAKVVSDSERIANLEALIAKLAGDKQSEAAYPPKPEPEPKAEAVDPEYAAFQAWKKTRVPAAEGFVPVPGDPTSSAIIEPPQNDLNGAAAE